MEMLFNVYTFNGNADLQQIQKVEKTATQITWNSNAHFGRYEVKDKDGNFLGFIEGDSDFPKFVKRSFIEVDKKNIYTEIDGELHTLETNFWQIGKTFKRDSFFLNQYELVSLLKKVEETKNPLSLTFFEHRNSYKGTPMRVKKNSVKFEYAGEGKTATNSKIAGFNINATCLFDIDCPADKIEDKYPSDSFRVIELIYENNGSGVY